MEWTVIAIITVIINLVGWAYFLGGLRQAVKANSARLKRIEGLLDFHFNGGRGGWSEGPAKSKKRG